MTQPSPTTPADPPSDTSTDTSIDASTDTSVSESVEVSADGQEETRGQVKKQMLMETTEEANAEAADVALAAVDELAELSGKVEELQQEVNDLQEQVLRRAAEFRNYRRRTESELGQTSRRGREEVVLALLDVFDDLRRSLGAASQAAQVEETGPAFNALNDGVQLVFKKFTDALASFGVEPIQSVGQPFDEELHDAMMQQPAPDSETPSGTVLAEIQPGYRMGDRILRHAQVVVAQ